MARFRKFALIFFNSRVINMLFLFTSLSKLPSGRVLKINIIMMGVAGGGSFVMINCQIPRTDGKENPQQLVKKITC